MLSRLLRLCLPGLGDAQYADCEREIAAYLAERSRRGLGEPATAYDRIDRRDVVQDINVI